MILTRSTSEHDGEQVDCHCHRIEDRQGLQAIGYWVFLQEENRMFRNPSCLILLSGYISRHNKHSGNLNHVFL